MSFLVTDLLVHPIPEDDTEDFTVPVDADAAKHETAGNLADLAKSGDQAPVKWVVFHRQSNDAISGDQD
jgi:hypothetical protein